MSKATSSHSSEAFLSKLIDYAGLFPPTQLPLESAIHNYASYMNNSDEWMLGSFVNPLINLHTLDPYISLFSVEKPLVLSGLGRKANNPEHPLALLEEDLKIMDEFREKHGQKVRIDFLEIPLPEVELTAEYFDRLARLIKPYGLTCYCEIPINGAIPSWEQHLQQMLQQIAKHNRTSYQELGVKLRTGGVQAELIPSIEIVAAFIYHCQEQKLPIKFTAGLHHPIRMFREEVQTEMHGFVNVFTAGLMAYAHHVTKQEIAAILADKEPKNFLFTDKALSWKTLEISKEQIIELRERYLRSYGSCSFDGPREEFLTMELTKKEDKCT